MANIVRIQERLNHSIIQTLMSFIRNLIGEDERIESMGFVLLDFLGALLECDEEKQSNLLNCYHSFEMRHGSHYLPYTGNVVSIGTDPVTGLPISQYQYVFSALAEVTIFPAFHVNIRHVLKGEYSNWGIHVPYLKELLRQHSVIPKISSYSRHWVTTFIDILILNRFVLNWINVVDLTFSRMNYTPVETRWYKDGLLIELVFWLGEEHATP